MQGIPEEENEGIEECTRKINNKIKDLGVFSSHIVITVEALHDMMGCLNNDNETLTDLSVDIFTLLNHLSLFKSINKQRLDRAQGDQEQIRYNDSLYLCTIISALVLFYRRNLDLINDMIRGLKLQVVDNKTLNDMLSGNEVALFVTYPADKI